ncbi:AraC family transcriptional regulator [Novosphingobium sp.]|uniref:AraC family transcriptional regulator n=1 Tax=Novosphingobium sp. TaxID=1874826 RepID=UPI00260145E0|nr:AraC family transcriptional regulator [Novosphingobium sp.]
MTPFPTLDLLARGGTLALLALWSLVLLRDHARVPAARAAVAMAAAIGAYILAGLLLATARDTLAALVCDVASVMAPPLFWLFARLWFDDRNRVGTRNWALIGGFALLPLAQVTLIATTGHVSIVIWSLVRVGMVGFGLAGMWVAWRGRASDLVEPRRAFRLALILAIGGFVLWVNLLEAGRVVGNLMPLARMPTQVAIFVVILTAVLGLHATRSPELFALPRPQGFFALSRAGGPVDEPKPTPAESPLTARLRHVMGHDRAYRAEGFSLTALAQLLVEPEYRVRRAINGELGFRNFTAFLNTYRLAEVKAALADAAQREVPILTIAIDAGFGSLGPFNRAFREAEGMTPSEWRAKSLVDSGIG